MIASLLPELICKVASFLDLPSLVHLADTCRSLRTCRSLIEDRGAWEAAVDRTPSLPLCDYDRSPRQLRLLRRLFPCMYPPLMGPYLCTVCPAQLRSGTALVSGMHPPPSSHCTLP